MARNKNSTALFDVIHAAKKPPKSSPSASIPAPRWWGKDKKPLKPATADASENVGKQQSWLSAAKKNASVTSQPPAAVAPMEAEPALPVVDESEAEITAEPVPAAPKVRFMDRFKSRPAEPAPIVEESTADTDQTANDATEPAPLPLPVFYQEADEPEMKPEPKRAREDRDPMFAVDGPSREIRFNLSYGGIVAIAFIMMIALAIAFIAGTHAQFASDQSDTRDTTPGAASSSGMMAAVNPTKPSDTEVTVPAKPDVKPDVLAVSPKSPKPAVDVKLPAAPPLTIQAKREIGLMYVIIQSYLDRDEAQKACDFVCGAGVPCTLVQGLNGWAPRDWYSVVGLKPFKKHDPAMQEDEKDLTVLGQKFSNNVLNQFQPQGYTWRGDSDQDLQP